MRSPPKPSPERPDRRAGPRGLIDSSEAHVRSHGADEVVDYTKHEFGSYLRGRGDLQDVVFDCVGGKQIEENAFLALKPSGILETVVGPEQYIGERKLKARHRRSDVAGRQTRHPHAGAERDPV